jgi:D-tyrosyl-tRNA(Tyr) deacylase
MVVQRVHSAALTANDVPCDTMEQGILALVGIQEGDASEVQQYMAEKLIHLRIFEDENGKMNRSVEEIGGSIYLVSNFTLYGDCRHGRRPSYTGSAGAEAARTIFDDFLACVRANTAVPVHSGVFQADMQIETTLDGPVTLLLDSDKTF